jgi:hypothetical protein
MQQNDEYSPTGVHVSALTSVAQTLTAWPAAMRLASPDDPVPAAGAPNDASPHRLQEPAQWGELSKEGDKVLASQLLA